MKLVEKYIVENKKRPSHCNKTKDIKVLGNWVSTQKTKYKRNLDIMKNENIREQWKYFIDKYQEYFMSYQEEWNNKLKLLEEYIVENKKRPSRYDKNKDIKVFGQWISNQKINYKRNLDIMKNENIREHWEEFIEKYPKYFRSNEEAWVFKLKLVEKYIIDNKKTPSQCDKNIEIKRLCKWLSNQQTNYKKNEYNMKNENIREQWEEFKEKYKQYFKPVTI